MLDDPATAIEIPHSPGSSASPPESDGEEAEAAGEGGAGGAAGGDGPSGGGSLRGRPADIVCALNFGVCLLHRRWVGHKQGSPYLQGALSEEGHVQRLEQQTG